MHGNVKNIGNGFRVKELVTKPNNVPVVFNGTIYVSDMQDDGTILIGLLDKAYLDDGYSG